MIKKKLKKPSIYDATKNLAFDLSIARSHSKATPHSLFGRLSTFNNSIQANSRGVSRLYFPDTQLANKLLRQQNDIVGTPKPDCGFEELISMSMRFTFKKTKSTPSMAPFPPSKEIIYICGMCIVLNNAHTWFESKSVQSAVDTKWFLCGCLERERMVIRSYPLDIPTSAIVWTIHPGFLFENVIKFQPLNMRELIQLHRPESAIISATKTQIIVIWILSGQLQTIYKYVSGNKYVSSRHLNRWFKVINKNIYWKWFSKTHFYVYTFPQSYINTQNILSSPHFI